MSDIAIEDHTYEFIAAAVAAAASGSALFEAEVHDTSYQTITQEYGIQIDDGESVLAPNPGATEVVEFDGNLVIIVFARVTGADKTERRAARAKMLSLAKAVAKLFLDDPTMGGRVNDARILSAPRGWISIGSQPYAVGNLPLLVNDSGAE